MKLKRSLSAFVFGVLFGCAVLSSALFCFGVFEFPVAVSKTFPIVPPSFPIQMKVDFGPAGKPGFDDKKFQVEKNTAAKEAVSQVYPVLSGRSCCSLRDVLAIDGVKIDPLKNRWWVCELNGSRRFSPHKKKLEPGDRVEWKYIQDEQ